MDLGELWIIFGPAVSGAVFGAGWWFWVDAVVCSSVAVSFLHYLPGIFASLAALMFNCVSREDIDYSPYDEGEWRLKLWLFLAYVISFVSLAGSVGLLVQDALVTTGPSAWTGTAGVLQCVFVLISIGADSSISGAIVVSGIVYSSRDFLLLGKIALASFFVTVGIHTLMYAGCAPSGIILKTLQGLIHPFPTSDRETIHF